ncbi:EbsA family protein [Vagococcus humatus]|uniref:Pore-forming protein n=1 Tax=Vagococcus humatus TaxID=1889241 RepID=A0A429Z8I9_9ENTE|nr:EbsA family protein [Vagococcus humatus]RST89998.1 hypothetical protein C7P63_02655 [Vagococcus humatus]
MKTKTDRYPKQLAKVKYPCQPELATSVIYWSLTFGIFFLSLIALLEETHLNLVTICLFGVFLFFVYLGRKRHVVLTETTVEINTSLKQNNQVIQLADIQQVSIGKYGLTLKFSTNDSLDCLSLLMRLKTKKEFLHQLIEIKAFTGQITPSVDQDI